MLNSILWLPLSEGKSYTSEHEKGQVKQLQIKIAKDYAEMSRLAADMISRLIEERPDAVLGLATGSTPVGLYEELVKRHKAGLDSPG